MLEGGLDRLLDEFRAAPVKHADETTWSCDGKHGYAWGFFTPTVSLYRLRGTRGSVVAKEVFGDGPHVGVLGVDRYAAYGKVWLGTIQYCMEHYKRNVGDLLEAEPENKEYKKYIPKFIELLKEAMTLRSTIRRLKPRTILRNGGSGLSSSHARSQTAHSPKRDSRHARR